MTKPSRKESRKEQIAREVRRREDAQGVPIERQVYVMKVVHGDEGGPQALYPREYIADRTFDYETWRARLAAAPAGWEPPELLIDDAEYTPDDDCCDADSDRPAKNSLTTSVGDFGEFQSLLLFSRRAVDVLEPLLRPCGVLLPMTCALGEYVGFRPDAVVDALDLPRTSAVWMSSGETASSIFRFHFFTEQLGPAAVFRIPQYSAVLVLQEFVDRVRGAGLSGFRFHRVWPTAVSMWWQERPY
jgi:hypothetical protein